MLSRWGAERYALIAAMLMVGCLSAELKSEPAMPSVPQSLLWQNIYRHVLLDIDHAPGRRPLESTIDALVQTLDEVTGKERIVVAGPTVIKGHASSAERAWREEELIAIERATSDHLLDFGVYGVGDTAVLHILFLDGGYRDVQGVQGIGRENTIYVFHDSVGRREHDLVDAYRLPEGPNHADAERHVAVHELGHALGLVNCGIPMLTARLSAEGVCHSTNPESPMGVDRDLVQDGQHRARYGHWHPWRFDANDLADLAGFRRSDPAGSAAPPPPSL